MNNYLIGVHARIEDAALLAEAGRYEGALLMLLVAMSATSRKYFPKEAEKSPGEAFKRFVTAQQHHLKGIEEALHASDPKTDLGDFLWTLRCALEHEGQLSINNHPVRDDIILTLEGDKTEGIGLTRQMLVSLEKAINRCGVNSYQATEPEVRQRHPKQPEELIEPTFIPVSPNEPKKECEERLERIKFFLKWFRQDQRAINALESEKANIEKIIQEIENGEKTGHH